MAGGSASTPSGAAARCCSIATRSSSPASTVRVGERPGAGAAAADRPPGVALGSGRRADLFRLTASFGDSLRLDVMLDTQGAQALRPGRLAPRGGAAHHPGERAAAGRGEARGRRPRGGPHGRPGGAGVRAGLLSRPRPPGARPRRQAAGRRAAGGAPPGGRAAGLGADDEDQRRAADGARQVPLPPVVVELNPGTATAPCRIPVARRIGGPRLSRWRCTATLAACCWSPWPLRSWSASSPGHCPDQAGQRLQVAGLAPRTRGPPGQVVGGRRRVPHRSSSPARPAASIQLNPRAVKVV